VAQLAGIDPRAQVVDEQPLALLRDVRKRRGNDRLLPDSAITRRSRSVRSPRAREKAVATSGRTSSAGRVEASANSAPSSEDERIPLEDRAQQVVLLAK
jgi:hypothetical protein